MSELGENLVNRHMDLYSRQIGVYGIDTMKKLSSANVLIAGIRGVGVETAKNLALAGVGSVCIYDPILVSIADLGTNFYLSASDVNCRTRGSACLEKLSFLNPYVKVCECTEPISESLLKKFDAVIVTSSDFFSFEELCRFDSYCHEHNILFALATVFGVTGSIFVDFGPRHVVRDATGEPIQSYVVEQITYARGSQSGYDVVVTIADRQHCFSDGDYVEIKGVTGIRELQEAVVVQVQRMYRKVKGTPERQILIPRQFLIRLDQVTGQYVSGGVVTEIRPEVEMRFKKLQRSAERPGSIIHPHAEKALEKDRANQLHVSWLAIWRFQKQNASLPRLHSSEDAEKCVELARAINEEHKDIQRGAPEADVICLESLDEDVVRKMALYASVELPGLTAFFGGVAAQEVVKCFNKFTPLNQWLHVDYYELLGDSVPEDGAPRGSRYDWQTAVIGAAQVEKLRNQKWFLVGCGALGCEYLKGFALMGLGCGPEGTIYATDMDRIEVSNLSRQFLFSKENVGCAKSAIAAATAKVMNPELNVRAYELAVGHETEKVFDDAFWTSLDGVCNALDNVKARLYIDSQCVFFEKALLEAGTLGTKANSEVILPHLTPSYAENKDIVQEVSVPVCTLRLFPYSIDHCIEWARSVFTDLYTIPIQDYNQFKEDPDEFLSSIKKHGNITSQLERLKIVEWLSHAARDMSFDTCMRLAMDTFNSLFHDPILQLITCFPRDCKRVSNSGEETLFWTGVRRFPRVLTLSLEDPLHLDYLHASSNLYASVFGVAPVADKEAFGALARERLTAAHESRLSTRLDLQEIDDTADQGGDGLEGGESEEVLLDLLNSARKQLGAKLSSAVPLEFKKDDDTNFHVDFLTACTNLRASNYRIEPASRHKVKMVAGRIVPALATTTAAITGLVQLELYKIVLGLRRSEFCCANVNLGTSTYELFEPSAPSYKKAEYDVIEMCEVRPVPEKFTVWDKVIIDEGRDLTLRELIDIFPKRHYGVRVDSLFPSRSTNGRLLYIAVPFLDSQKKEIEKNLSRPVTDVYKELYDSLEGKGYVLLSGTFQDASGAPVTIPIIKYIFERVK